MNATDTDPRVTAYALGEDTDDEIRAAVDESAEMQAEVGAVRRLAEMLRTSLAAEADIALTPEQRAAVLTGASAGGRSSWIGDRRRQLAAAAVVVAFLGAGALLFRRGASEVALPTPADSQAGQLPGRGGRPLLALEPTPGVHFRLSDAPASAPPAPEAIRSVSGAPVPADELAAYLARMPALQDTAAVTTSFALRPGPQPPAIPGEAHQQPWPPPATAEAPALPAAGPLTVVRAGPEGEVPMATQLTLTFSEPMVPLTSHGEAELSVPVTLSPEVEGQWRWVGTKTLIFEPDPRFPMANEFTATVPAGTTSATGAVLSEAFNVTFGTPPPRLIESYPSMPTNVQGPWAERRQIVFVGFNQRVEPAVVLEHTRVTADGQTVAMRVAAPAEVAENEDVSARAQRALPDTWAALVPTVELPLGSEVEVALDEALPSAEGPRTLGEEATFGFEVYRALAIIGMGCGGAAFPGPMIHVPGQEDVEASADRAARLAPDRVDGCVPGSPWHVNFNNTLDLEIFDPTAFTMEPALTNAEFEPIGPDIAIKAPSVGRTAYRVTLPAEIGDVYGQRLGRPAELEFEMGDAPPELLVPGQDMFVLDPSAAPLLPLASVNQESVKATLYAVTPADWPAFLQFLDGMLGYVYGWNNEAGRPVAPWEPSWTGELVPEGERDALTRVDLDLAPALHGDTGHVVAIIEPDAWVPGSAQSTHHLHLRWVQITDLSMMYARDANGSRVWVTELGSGRPIANADVSFELGGDSGDAVAASRTTGDGLALLPGPGKNVDRAFFVARHGSDAALLPAGYHGQQSSEAPYLWYVIDDRGIYRPGERAYVKGWLRPVDWGTNGDLEVPASDVGSVSYVLTSVNGHEIASGAATLSSAGGFELGLDLPSDIDLGPANLALRTADGTWGADHAIEVAEFRRPEFEVEVSPEEPHYILGETAYATVAARYYAGGPLPGAEARWNVFAEATVFTPPNRSDFYFGRRSPWWWHDDPYGPGHQEHTARTDSEGGHRLAIDIERVAPLAPVSVRAEAVVQDVNRQAWADDATFLVHPSRYYVGLRPAQWFVDAGETIEVDAIVTDLDGALIAGVPIALNAVRLETVFRGGEFVENAVPAGGCELVSAGEPLSCAVRLERGGRYRISATIADPEGRPNETELQLWASGGPPPVLGTGASVDQVELIPDQDSYAPGGTAYILVRSPFADAEGWLTIRRGGVAREERFRIEGSSTTLAIAISETDMPGVTAHVELVGAAPGPGADGEPDANLPSRPAAASGEIALPVETAGRKLEVSPVPRADTLSPGESTVIDVRVRDAAGAAVASAEVALVVVDESILALTDYTLPDPVEMFHPDREPGVTQGRLHDLIWLADVASLREKEARSAMGEMNAAGGGGGSLLSFMGVADEAPSPAGLFVRQGVRLGEPSPAGAPALVAERTNLDPLALFEGTLLTDDRGIATAEVTLPDNVTRYRVMAVASDGAKSFGLGESTITARLPLAVRPSAPRFLNFGDVFELPVVVQNQTESELDTYVVVRTANLSLEGDGAATAMARRVSVPANDRIEVRFPAAAASPGQATFQAAAFSGELADAQRISLPVWTPATTEAFATYGELDEGSVVQPVRRPDAIVEEFGGLEMTLTSTALGNLTDAYLYLESYPFRSSEAVASRLLATVALRDVLEAFDTENLPDETAIDSAIRQDLAFLAARQSSDGGFGWWNGPQNNGRGSHPFSTVHVAHALARARANGFALDESSIGKVQQYLRDLDHYLREWHISGEAAHTLKAYGLYVRLLLGERDVGRARALLAEPGGRRPDALGWLLSVVSGDESGEAAAEEIRRLLNNAASEEAATAQFTTAYEEGESQVVLASDRRTDAVVLEAMIGDQPDNPLIPKLARGLLAHRVKGRWKSTQENVFVLLALGRYFRTYEGETPAFLARSWLGTSFVGESEFRGRSADRHETDVPFAALPSGQTVDLLLAKEGVGRLYYRLGLRYAPESLELEPSEHGFSVVRTYEAVDDPGDVIRRADGAWEVRAGALVRVRLKLVADSRRYHVALADPLPAGLEALNPDLAVFGTLPEAEMESGDGMRLSRWWPWRWYDHHEFRDERTEAFTASLEPGVYNFDYIARATTLGSFIVPPARTEEMFHPETFGRSGTDRMIVR